MKAEYFSNCFCGKNVSQRFLHIFNIVFYFNYLLLKSYYLKLVPFHPSPGQSGKMQIKNRE
jgi:hypothetical protein